MKLVVTGLDGIGKWANQQVKAFDVAATNAVNRTAFKVREAEMAAIQSEFDRPNARTSKSVFVTRAKVSARPEAEIYIKDKGAGLQPVRWLEAEVYGGKRNMKSHERQLGAYTTPLTAAPRDRYGNVPGSFYVKVLSQLGVSTDARQNATNSKRSKAKRARESFFMAGDVILSRKGETVRPMLSLLKTAPKYSERLKFSDIAQSTYLTNFSSRFDEELRKARRS